MPHVDAFRYGFEVLCEFIDYHIAVKCNTECLNIDDDERSKILLIITSRGFDENEARPENATELE